MFIRSMTKQELGVVMKWAETEGWNPGKYDHHSYYAMDNRGHFLLLENEKPIGAISVVRYSSNFSFIGLFIVLPEYRSKGLGKMLWQHAMEYINESKIGLYAVPQQISRYKNSGFKEYCQTKRWGKLSPGPEHYEQSTNLIDKTQNPAKMFQKLCKYDKRVFGYSRKKLFKCMLSMPQTYAFVSLDDIGKVNGYGVVRPCRKGFRIGPLYTDDYESAKLLCRILLTYIPGEKVIFDIPTVNTFSLMFAEYFNLENISTADTVSMFKGNEPMEMNYDKCYGINSLELG